MNSEKGLKKPSSRLFIFPLAVILSGCVLSSSNPSFASPYASLELGGETEGSATDDGILLFEDETTRKYVLSFYKQVAGSEPIALAILENSAKYSIPPSLAFALAWEESKFDPLAFNKNAKSLDRGLFQLNSSSFPKMSKEEFYDPKISSNMGLAHLRWCLDSGGNEVAALAMYNAGTKRVSTGGTPKRTLDYVSRILKREAVIASEFQRLVASQHPMRLALAGL
jgi:hypothetical protein